MWDWIVRQWEKFTNWLSSGSVVKQTNTFPPVVNTRNQENPPEISFKGNDLQQMDKLLKGIKENKNKNRDSINQLKVKALQGDVVSAKELLNMKDLKNNLTLNELCKIFYKHREKLLAEIQICTRINHISIFDIAKDSVENALMILKSRLCHFLDPKALANIYYHHRMDQQFHDELTKPQVQNTAHVPTLLQILQMAKKKNVYETVLGIIEQSSILKVILKNEVTHKPSKTPARERIVLPEKDPYEVLEVDRDADSTAINQAYRKKAQKFHPDKNQETIVGRRFMNAKEACEFLLDPIKRKAWDDAHPARNPSPMVRF